MCDTGNGFAHIGAQALNFIRDEVPKATILNMDFYQPPEKPAGL